MKIQFRIAILLFTMIACAGSAKDAQKGSLGMQGSIPEIIVENPPSNTGAHYEYLTPYASEPVNRSIMSAIQTSSTVGSRSQLVFEILVSDNPELYLRVCVVLKRFDLADALLENGLTLSIVDSAELSLFHVAALVSSDISICEFLAQRGAPINYMDVSGYTPLDYAIQKKNLEMIRYLLAMGAKKSADLRSVKHHGLGVRLNVQKDHLYAVESFREMSPARESGLIQVGDTISKIDGIDLKGRSIFFITQRIAGNIGTEIVLELIDPQGATRTCVLNRGIYN